MLPCMAVEDDRMPIPILCFKLRRIGFLLIFYARGMRKYITEMKSIGPQLMPGVL